MNDSLRDELLALETHVGAFVPNVALIHLTGDDAISWLQGQITQDVREMRPGESRYGLLLNANGKIVADMHILAREEGLLLLLPPEGRAAAVAQMDRYIVMEDVEMEAPEGHSPPLLALQGPGAAAMLEPLRQAGAEVYEVDLLGLGGLVIVGDSSSVSGEGAPVSDAAVEVARIRAGTPRFGADFGPNTLPQVAGLKERAVSFSKGCYLGQEQVVMLEHRGSPPKRLSRLSIEGSMEVGALVGADLLGEDDAVVGTVTSATRAPEGSIAALGFVKRGRTLEDVVKARPSGDSEGDATCAARALSYVGE